MALGRNHAAKHSVSVNVVTVSVLQASFLSQVFSSSGSQASSQSPLVVGVVVTMRSPILVR